jgi:HlyD family secretion protein
MKRVAIAILIIVVIAGSAYYLFGSGKSNSEQQVQARKTVLPKRGDLRVSINATGQIEPVKAVEVKSKASGEVTKLFFEAGDYVNKNDLLCKIDESQVRYNYDKAVADLAVAEVSAKIQEKAFKRQQEMYQKGLIPESDMDNAELSLEQTRAQVVRTRAARDDAKKQLDDTVIRSPINGLILKCNVEEGQIIASGVSNVSGGTLLMQIAQTDSVYVVAQIDETDIGKVELGQKVEVEADAFPDKTFHGEVLKIAPISIVQQNVTIFEVTTKVDNPERKLKAGMNANIEVITSFSQNALLVPNAAVKDPKKMGVAGDMMPPGGSGGPGGPGMGNPAMAERFGKQFQDKEASGKNRKIVLVVANGELMPRSVIVGANNLDYTEILEGIAETDSVDATPLSRMMQDRAAMRDRMTRFSSVPGMKKQDGK